MSLRTVVRDAAHACVFAAGVLLLACGSDHTSAPADAGTIVAAAGDAQEGNAGETLGDTIAVTVRDRAGAAVRGVRVTWATPDSGEALPPQSVTDADGRARVRWTLGPTDGTQRLTAYAEGYVPLTLRADANPSALGLNTVRALELTTYEGSGQTVHPDFIALGPESAMHGERLALTPYPFGESTWENPALYTSHDRIRWNPERNALNPVAYPQHGYLSDPDLVYDPARDEVRLYYRQVDVENEIMLTRTRNAIEWSAPELVAHAPNHQIISPAVVRRSASEWLMWAVNGQGGCAGTQTTIELRRSADGLAWSDPETVDLTQKGFYPWHVEVQWIPSRREYWALYNAKSIESCSTPALFLATSADGVTWKTFPSPVLERGDIAELRDIVYRSTFAYDPGTGVVTFWFSGARYESLRYVWRSVVQRRRLADVFKRITAEPTHGIMALRAGVPPLMDPP
jgi:hypothetical protein